MTHMTKLIHESGKFVYCTTYSESISETLLGSLQRNHPAMYERLMEYGQCRFKIPERNLSYYYIKSDKLDLSVIATMVASELRAHGADLVARMSVRLHIAEDVPEA